MDEPNKAFAPELSPLGSKRWIGRLLIAVILGAAIWNFVLVLTTAVILPGLAQVMEADPQSPLYLGKGDFNVPAIFAAVLELCLALIGALVVNSWAQRRPRPARRKGTSPAPAANLSIAVPAAPAVSEPIRQVSPPAAAAAVAAPIPQKTAAPVPELKVPVAQTPTAPPAVKAEKPAKPKAPKEVYYNIVGEPIEPDDE